MSYDASAQNLRCPFCGSEKLDEDKSNRTLRAKYIIPFNTSQDDILAALKKWLGSSFWRPSDLVQRAVLTNVTAVYVPYWIFSARTFTYWTADSSAVPWTASGDWMPVTGEHHSQYSGVLVGASSVLTQSETNAICPYNLDAAKTPDQVETEKIIVEQFRVQRKYARPLARQSIEALERNACRKYVEGRSRNVKVNTRLEGLMGQPVLLPVWVLAYQYKGELYRFLVNGQTGRHTGTAPVSWQKILMVIAIVLLVILGVLFLIGGVGVIGSMAG